MLGIVWGIATVTLLIAYGGSFREILVSGFDAFGKGAVIAWPQQTSEQPGGQRAGKKVVLEQADLDMIKETATLCSATRVWKRFAARALLTEIAWLVPLPFAEFVRNMATCETKQPSEGRWINSLDQLERRRVVFLGARVREQLFERKTRRWGNRGDCRGSLHRDWHHGSQDSAEQLFFQRRRIILDPLLRRKRPLECAVRRRAGFRTHRTSIRGPCGAQVLAALANRQQFSPTDPKALQMFGREEFRPVINGITIGLQVLLIFIGMLDARHRRRRCDEHHACLGRRTHPGDRITARFGRSKVAYQAQFLAETLLIMLLGGAIGIVCVLLGSGCRGNAALDGAPL